MLALLAVLALLVFAAGSPVLGTVTDGCSIFAAVGMFVAFAIVSVLVLGPIFRVPAGVSGGRLSCRPVGPLLDQAQPHFFDGGRCA